MRPGPLSPLRLKTSFCIWAALIDAGRELTGLGLRSCVEEGKEREPRGNEEIGHTGVRSLAMCMISIGGTCTFQVHIIACPFSYVDSRVNIDN